MKWKFILVAGVLGLLSCHDSRDTSRTAQKAEPGTGANQKLSTTASRGRRSYVDSGNNPYYVDTIKKGNDYAVLGDSTTLPTADNLLVALKFKSYLHFADLPATVLAATHAPIRYSSRRWARQFRPVITETYNREGVNFGGHYCFAYWGCGSTCWGSVLVDVRTGIVYEGVDAGNGYAFKKDSRLLIANPPDSSGFYVSLGPRIYVWDEAKKQFEQRE